MPNRNGHVREHVMREMREEIRDLAGKGLSVDQIEQRVNGHRALTRAEQSLADLLTYHAVKEAKGRY